MRDVGRVLFGLRNAHDVDEAIQKSLLLAEVVNAVNDTELDEVKRTMAHVWQSSMMGLLAVRLMPDYSAVAEAAIARLMSRPLCLSTYQTKC